MPCGLMQAARQAPHILSLFPSPLDFHRLPSYNLLAITATSLSSNRSLKRAQVSSQPAQTGHRINLQLRLARHYYSRRSLHPHPSIQPFSPGHPENFEFMSGETEIQNLKSRDPFAEADEDSGQTTQTQEYIHIRIQQRNGRKTLTTVQGIPAKFDHKKILKVIKKEFACNGTIISDTESKGMGEVIQLQGDHRIKIRDFLVNEETGLAIDEKNIKIHGF